MRSLVVVLGDQLDPDSAALEGLDPRQDVVWMAEVREEIDALPSHKLRIALFLSAMRHFRDALRERGVELRYTELAATPAGDRGASLGAILSDDLRALAPRRVVLMRPGDHRVDRELRAAVKNAGAELDQREDQSFFATPAEFSAWARGRKTLLQEGFYRALRRRHGILVDAGGAPEGGRWNLDAENRRSFGRKGPGALEPPAHFAPDRTTREVLELVEKRFASHPGSASDFDLPVTTRDARRQLDDFVRQRLARFGPFEDAIWAGEPFLFHSRLSAALNLKLISPRDCVDAALAALASGEAPLNSVEGFVRQILGWREFVRGVYWHLMPGYAEHNALGCEDRGVPAAFWNGETRMACVADAMGSVLAHGYAHHIVRLMVLGLFAQLLGVHPRRFHDWHMAMYVDAIDWVSLPNTLGMSQYGDGGIVGTKPYCATGSYIRRMSNHCATCPYDPARASGERACPFTALYWDFLARHRSRFARNPRMSLQLRNLERKPRAELASIRAGTRALRRRIERGGEL